MEGVTKHEQAGRANGVHTEVSVCRQDPPPVGDFVLPCNYPGAELFCSSLARSFAHGRGAYDVFPDLGHVERVTFSTQSSCPAALLAPRRCTYRGTLYRTPMALVRSSPTYPFDGPSCLSPRSGSFFVRCPRSGSFFVCVCACERESSSPFLPHNRSCFEGPFYGHPI